MPARKIFTNYIDKIKWVLIAAQLHIVLFYQASKDFMEQQQRGFSDSTPGAGNDRLQKSAKSLLSALQLMFISQTSTQKYGSGHFDPFLITRKICPIGGRLRNESTFWEFLDYIFAYFKRMK